MPNDLYEAYSKNITGADTTVLNNTLVPCQGTTLPDLAFFIQPPTPDPSVKYPDGGGGTSNQPLMAVVPGSTLMGNATSDKTKCTIALSPSNGKGNNWDLILGLYFIQAMAGVVFDMTSPNGNVNDKTKPIYGQIGIAPKSGSSGSTGQSTSSGTNNGTSGGSGGGASNAGSSAVVAVAATTSSEGGASSVGPSSSSSSIDNSPPSTDSAAPSTTTTNSANPTSPAAHDAAATPTSALTTVIVTALSPPATSAAMAEPTIGINH